MPPRRQSLVSWIRKHVVVTDGRAQGRRIVLEKWQRLLLQRIDREKRVITACRMASQIGKTTIVVPIALRAAIDGAGVLLASSTETNIRDMARRLDGVLEAAPDLAAHFPSARSGPGARASWKDRRTTGLGWLGFASAGSASQLAARTVQVAVADEVARFPRRVRSGEGSPMQLLRARLLDWGTDAKLIAISSPTLPTDTISTMFSDGDQNRLEYRCPSCGHRTPLRWGQVAGVEQGEQPGIACASCGVLHSERTRRAMLPSAVWVAQKRDRVDERIASYTAGRLDSARASLTEIVLEWRAARLDAERGNNAAMLGFRNTILGEPGDLGVADVDLLLESRERTFNLAAVEQVCAGVDVQDDRLVYQVLGFAAADAEMWALDGGEVLGDPRDDEVWIALHSILVRHLRRPAGQRHRLRRRPPDHPGQEPDRAPKMVGAGEGSLRRGDTDSAGTAGSRGDQSPDARTTGGTARTTRSSLGTSAASPGPKGRSACTPSSRLRGDRQSGRRSSRAVPACGRSSPAGRHRRHPWLPCSTLTTTWRR